MASAALTRMVRVDAIVGRPFQNTRMSSVSRPGVSRHSPAAISPVVYICATPGASRSPWSAIRWPVGLVAADQPVLLAGGVEVVAPGGQAGLHHLAAVLGERADRVAHHAGSVEQLGQRGDLVLDLDDLVRDRVDARHLVERLGDPRLVPARPR